MWPVLRRSVSSGKSISRRIWPVRHYSLVASPASSLLFAPLPLGSRPRPTLQALTFSGLLVRQLDCMQRKFCGTRHFSSNSSPLVNDEGNEENDPFEKGFYIALKERDPHKGFEWLKAMIEHEMQPTTEMYHKLLYLSGSLKQRELLDTVFSHMPPAFVTLTTQQLLVTMYAQMGDVAELHKYQQRFNIPPNVMRVFLLEAYATRRDFHQARRVLEEIEVAPPEATFAYVLEQFRSRALEFEHFWKEMSERFQLQPQSDEMFTVLICALSDQGKIEPAAAFLEQMYEKRMNPSTKIWWHFLRALQAQDLEVVEKEKWIETVQAKYERGAAPLTPTEVKRLGNFLKHVEISLANVRDQLIYLKGALTREIEDKPKPKLTPLEHIPEPAFRSHAEYMLHLESRQKARLASSSSSSSAALPDSSTSSTTSSS